jgi:tubulin monoglycylase TTLL3/8
MVDEHKNAMELTGYDFMIDENLNPWLIEINSSPSMSTCTNVSKRLVPMVLEDCVKVSVDYGMSKKGKKKI